MKAMNEAVIKRHQRRYMAYNFVAFSIIFGMFGGIIYGQMRISLFSRVDDDLRTSQATILARAEFIDYQRNLRFEPSFTQPLQGEPRTEERMKVRIFTPMRVQVVVRDALGEIVNEQALGRMYWENNLSQIPLPLEKHDNIATAKVGNAYFRQLVFQAPDSNGEWFTIQLIANVDGEQGLIDNFLSLLIVCIAAFILLSITASYLLSKKNMSPLLRSWRRQAEVVENASHELRTPLTIIQTKLEGLLTAPQATILDKADSIAVSLSETRRLTKLTSELMTLARADSDAVQLAKEPFSLSELIRAVSEPYVEFASMQQKQMELLLEEPAPITADRARLHELMVILLDNALKYTQEGDSITVHTCQKENRIVLEVKDTGIGIGEESLERIFDRFYREDKARSRENGGSGLGLSIAQWIVDTHDGAIRAYPNTPSGTVIEVKLPRQ